MILAITLIFGFVGANAIRRSSIPAAAFMTLLTFMIPLQTYLEHSRYDPIEIALFVVFVVILRGVWLTSSWLEEAPLEDRLKQPLRISQILPLQIHGRLGDIMIDRWPSRIWPRFQYAFWATGAITLCILVTGIVLDYVPGF